MNLKSESIIVVPKEGRPPAVYLMGGYIVSVIVNNGKPCIKHNPQVMNFEVMVRPRILMGGKGYLKAWPRAMIPNPKYGFGYCLVKDGIVIAGGALSSYTQTDTCSLYYHR